MFPRLGHPWPVAIFTETAGLLAAAAVVGAVSSLVFLTVVAGEGHDGPEDSVAVGAIVDDLAGTQAEQSATSVDTHSPTRALPTEPTSSRTPALAPTVRSIELPVAPSEAAIACSQAGLVAAGLDACLRYEALGCTYWNSLGVCDRARDQLEVVHRTRVFPMDCLILPRSELDRPEWCHRDR